MDDYDGNDLDKKFRQPRIVADESIEVTDQMSPSPPTNRSRSSVQMVDTDISTASPSSASSGDHLPFHLCRPPLQRSESILRRRIATRAKKEKLWEKKHGQPLKKTTASSSNPIDLDALDDEEEMLRRNSNHGLFGVIPSSLSLSSSGCSCRSYRRDRLIKEIDEASSKGNDAVLKTLNDAGILVYIIDSKVRKKL
jgi:hypothetical protein